MGYNIPYDTNYSQWYGTPQNVTRLSAVLEQTKNEDGDPVGRITASWDVPDNGGVFNILLSTDGAKYKIELLNVSGNSAIMDVEPNTGYYIKVVTVLGGNQSTGTVLQVSVATIPTPSAPVLTALSTGIQIDAGIVPAGYTVQMSISDGTNTEIIGSSERITMYMCDSGSYSVTTAFVDVNGNVGTASQASTISVSGAIAIGSSDYLKGASVSGNVLTITRGDNDTVTFENTTYSSFVGSGESAAGGLVPPPPQTAGTTKFLCEDGNWEVPAGGGGGGSITVDSTITENGTNPVESSAIYGALYSVSRGVAFPVGALTIPSDMLVNSANQLLYYSKNRNYYKKYNGDAGGALCCISINGNSYICAILVAETSDAVIGYSTYDTSYLGTSHEIASGGRTYYWSDVPYGWYGNDKRWSNLHIRDLTDTTFSSYVDAADYILNNILLVLDRTLAEYHITDAYTKTEVDALIAGGGGGGAGNASGVTRNTLYSGVWSSGYVDLPSPITDYDFIELKYNIESHGTKYQSNIVSSQYLSANIGGRYEVDGYDTRYFAFYITSVSRFTFDARVDLRILEINGIKISKNLTEQMFENVLYENSSGVNSGNISLSDGLSNYDLVAVSLIRSGYLNEYINFMPVSELVRLSSSTVGGAHLSVFGYDTDSVNLYYADDTTLTILNYTGIAKISRVFGIKLAKGGYSGIVTDARMTVKSGFLDLSSGLTRNSSNTFDIAFDSPMPDANYTVLFDNYGQPDGYGDSLITVKDKTVNGFKIFIYQRNEARQNLSGNGVSWVAIRSNSYTREGMTEDVLFSSASGVSSGTINLSGNISDYDLIEFVYGESNYTYQSYSEIFLNEDIQNCIANSKYLVLNVVGNSYFTVGFSSNTTVYRVASSGVNIYKIIGIKFGRYVSGVAVDTTVTQGSQNVVTSGAVYNAIAALEARVQALENALNA